MYRTSIPIRRSVLILLSTTLVLSGFRIAYAADPITLQNEPSRIIWGPDFPRDAEYKDVQLAPFNSAGDLMLYLPVTRPDDENHMAALMQWDSSANGGNGAFVDNTGTSLPFQNASSNRDTYDVDFVDIDRDGDFDIVHSSPHGNFLYINNGSGVFSDETSSRFPPFARTDLVDVWDDVVVADADGDGDIDIMFSNRTFRIRDGRPFPPNPASWGPSLFLYNDGQGYFNRADGPIETNYDLFGINAPAPYLGEMEAASHGAKFGDLNNDGRLDMVISHSSTYASIPAAPPGTPAAVDVYINLGSTTSGRINWASSISYGGTNYVANIGLFDVDADGDLDIYLARPSGSDFILLNQGDGTFPTNANDYINVEGVASPGTISENGSYDVVFGDLNDDDLIDVVAPEVDGFLMLENKIFLNDTTGTSIAFERSNDAVINSTTNPHQVSAAIADVDDDGRLDIVWGIDARSERNPETQPMITMNTTSGLSDTHPPVINQPNLFLSANGTPSAVFALRIRDRVQDLDEITAMMQWSTTGSSGGRATGSAPLEWAATDSYQSRLSCTALRQGFGLNETITDFTWQVSATDASGNTSTLMSSDPGAANLQPALGSSSGTALSFSVREPLENSGSLTPNDGTGRLLIRLAMNPLNVVPSPEMFSVQINGSPATVITGQRVANEYWLVVLTPSGPMGAHELQVSFRLCNLVIANSVIPNAVFYDDDVRLSDTVLVLDASGSMGDDSKFESAVNAAHLYANVMRDAENIGVVEYSGSSGVLASNVFGPEIAGNIPPGGPPPADNRAAAAEAAAAVSLGGCTPLGQGLLVGLNRLNAIPVGARNARRTLVLLSDAKENVPPFWGDPPMSTCGALPTGSPVYNVFEALQSDADPTNDVRINTISFGPDAEPRDMNNIAIATRGDTLAVDVSPAPPPGTPQTWMASALQLSFSSVALASHQSNRLADAYEHHHNSASYQQRLWQDIHFANGRGFHGDNNEKEEVRLDSIKNAPGRPQGEYINAIIEPELTYAAIAINWASTLGTVRAAYMPDDQNPSDVKVVRSGSNAVFQIENPVPGRWLFDTSHPAGTELLTTVSGISSEVGFARALTGETVVRVGKKGKYLAPRVLEPGESIPLRLVLVGYKPVVEATVSASAFGEANQTEVISMTDNGEGEDLVAGDGIYSGLLQKTEHGGRFAITIDASWRGKDGAERQRVFPLSVVMHERDSDGDSVSDIDEIRLDLNPEDPYDVFEDHDQDGLPTWFEIDLRFNPYNPDSDQGGVPDGAEFERGTDPMDFRDDKGGNQEKLK